MGKRKVAALEKIDADFASLQYKIRRDPKSYEDEFRRQYEQYVSQRDLFLTAPANASTDQARAFHDLIDLLAHVADCYPEALQTFPGDLAAILTQHHAVLHPELRDKLVGSLSLLRRKSILDSATLAQTLFPILVHTPSKTLRTLLFGRLVADLRNANSRATDHKLNRTVQTVLYNLVTSSERTSPQPIWAVKITRELWSRRVWTDAKPVDVMREACLSDNEKVVVGAVRFFLGGDKARGGAAADDDSDDSSDDENPFGDVFGSGGGGGGIDLQKIKQRSLHNKKTRKVAKRYEKAVDKIKKMERKKHQPQALNFSALHLLHGPQEFTEALFMRHLQSSKCKFSLESKLQILQLVTRLHGLHKLLILPLFSWFTKYLTPRQTSVTTFLASLAQAVHDQVPPDTLEPLLAKIANEFVSEASAAEVASAGLAAIREVSLRQPLAMNETLLQDLVLLRKSKDKSVMMAARGLLSLFRVVGAEMLAKKDRGKEATMGLRSGEMTLRKYGEEAIGGIEGIELLEQWKAEEKKRKREERAAVAAGSGGDEDEDGNEDEDENSEDSEDSEANSSDWDMSDDSNDSGGWIDVSSEDEAEKLPRLKRQRRGKKKDEDSEDEEEDDDDDDEDESDNSNASDGEGKEAAETNGPSVSKLATTTVLTPADLAKLKELRMAASVDKAMGRKTSASAAAGGKAAAGTTSRYEKAMAARHADDGLTAAQIELAATLRKSTKEERIARAQAGKPGRDAHQATQAVRQQQKAAAGKSLTNAEKARKKNIFMTMGKARAKNKRSLVQTSKTLRAHVARAKKGGRRGNRD
ncbi:sda1 domain containing protein [Niveomyces insectorum RCEF 264]|uniref:Protein SDA1 n=1 Tax=Niveomyces insectorum RCEF 264 TaxID=1081102 RepID=A0A162IDZ1_9HYPO|nr:sda1 domain containing protein [Niveomyces insectorum RCEF 264]